MSMSRCSSSALGCDMASAGICRDQIRAIHRGVSTVYSVVYISGSSFLFVSIKLSYLLLRPDSGAERDSLRNS